MKQWKDLNEHDKTQLLRFPAYISLLASTAEGGIDRQETDAAIKLSHIKTFAGDPELHGFYKAVDKDFEKQLIDLDKELPHTAKERKTVIVERLRRLETVLTKLDKRYASLLRHSMHAYKDHVSKAHRNILEYFIFPLPIEGLSN